jgi:hypothetical protein
MKMNIHITYFASKASKRFIRILMLIKKRNNIIE